MKNTLVSIITSTFERPLALRRAIESVLKQTYQNWEMIIVDDYSSSYDFHMLQKDFSDEPRLRFIQLEKNHGKDTKPKNTGIIASRGDLICYLDDDCEFGVHHISRLVGEIQVSGADVVYCDMTLVDPQGNRGPGIAMDFDAQYLLKKNFIDTNMVLHTREIVFSVGGWDETLPRFVDWNLWVRMMKWGAKFHHVPEKLTLYHISPNNSAVKHPVPTHRDPYFGVLFEPTFDPAGCKIFLQYLYDGKDDEIVNREAFPNVAIFTLSYDRLEYTSRIFKSMKDTAGYPFDWYVIDQGSKDGSAEFLEDLFEKDDQFVGFKKSEKNLGITGGSNECIDAIARSHKNYQIIIKIDNDCAFTTMGWLETVVDLWKRNHKLYTSPYVEGLVHNPGGAQRVGYAHIGPYFVEVTQHIGGIFAAIDARAYREFRWKDQFLHGNQDMEASMAFRKQGFMPMYFPVHRVQHVDGTEGQQEKFPEYFERRKQEKTTTL